MGVLVLREVWLQRRLQWSSLKTSAVVVINIRVTRMSVLVWMVKGFRPLKKHR